jgi:molecular chaperone GrpE
MRLEAGPAQAICGQVQCLALLREVNLTELDREKTTVVPIDTSEQADRPEAKALQAQGSRQPVKLSEALGELHDLDILITPEREADALEQALKESAENRDRWMRAVAELENYKKRTLQEKSKLLKYRNEELLRELLPTVDNMERALSHCESEGRCDPLTEGVSMISGMFRDILGRFGVTEVKSLDEPFDPHVHEALARIPVQGRQPNTVVEVLEKGYLYQDRLLRPAKVVVSAAVADGEVGNDGETGA